MKFWPNIIYYIDGIITIYYNKAGRKRIIYIPYLHSYTSLTD